jgi:phosphoglycerate dehydrogenase-like enzyme
MVAEKAEWGKRKLGKGAGLGIAAHRSFLTYVATVVEVKTGFIGLGNMGSRIAQRLLDRGYQLSVYDLDLAKAGLLVSGTSRWKVSP